MVAANKSNKSRRSLKCKRYSCPSLVVDYTEELISRTFQGVNRFRLVSQDRISSENTMGWLVFVWDTNRNRFTSRNKLLRVPPLLDLDSYTHSVNF